MSISGISEIVVAAAALAGIGLYGINGKRKDSDNDVLTNENLSLRRQLSDSKQECAVASATIKENTKRIEDYQSLIQSRPNFEKLSVASSKLSLQMGTQHSELLENFSLMTKEITNLAKVIAAGRKDG